MIAHVLNAYQRRYLHREVFRFSWKWRKRSLIKLMERTHEEATEAIRAGKAAILRRHLLDKEPISKLCDEVGLQPTVFYRWQKEFFENGAAAFEQRRRSNQERIAYLEKKIQTKDEVLAELMAEHVALKKKTLRNSDRELGSARYAGSERGFRPALVGEDQDRRRAVHWVARHHCQQVLGLAGALREAE